MNYFVKLLKKLKPQTRQEKEYAWLAKSTDLVDLERRQKELIYNGRNQYDRYYRHTI